MNLIVLTYANYRNQFLDEWEKSVKRNGLTYKILGSGEKWDGHMTKLKAYAKELNVMNDNDLVILCDAFDLLFLADSQEIIDKYNKLTPEHKIVISSDTNCPDISASCSKEQLKCYKDTKNVNYVCAGFIMGLVKDLKKAHKEILILEKNFKNDDQIAWDYYRSKHCNEVVLDTNYNICLTYVMAVLSMESMDKFIKYENGRIYNSKFNNYPCVVHMPAHYLYPSVRSEKFRNYLFPERNPISHQEYFNQLLKFCKINLAEFICMIIFPVLFVLLFFVLVTKSALSILYTIIFFGIILLVTYIVLFCMYKY